MKVKEIIEAIEGLDFVVLSNVVCEQYLSKKSLKLLLDKCLLVHNEKLYNDEDIVSYDDYIDTIYGITEVQDLDEKTIIKYKDIFFLEDELVESLIMNQKLTDNIIDMIILEIFDLGDDVLDTLLIYYKNQVFDIFFKNPTLLKQIIKEKNIDTLSKVIKLTNDDKKVNNLLMSFVILNHNNKKL